MAYLFSSGSNEKKKNKKNPWSVDIFFFIDKILCKASAYLTGSQSACKKLCEIKFLSDSSCYITYNIKQDMSWKLHKPETRVFH